MFVEQNHRIYCNKNQIEGNEKTRELPRGRDLEPWIKTFTHDCSAFQVPKSKRYCTGTQKCASELQVERSRDELLLKEPAVIKERRCEVALNVQASFSGAGKERSGAAYKLLARPTGTVSCTRENTPNPARPIAIAHQKPPHKVIHRDTGSCKAI